MRRKDGRPGEKEGKTGGGEAIGGFGRIQTRDNKGSSPAPHPCPCLSHLSHSQKRTDASSDLWKGLPQQGHPDTFEI